MVANFYSGTIYLTGNAITYVGSNTASPSNITVNTTGSVAFNSGVGTGSIANLDFGTSASTWNTTATGLLTVTGNITLSPNMTVTATGSIMMTAAAGTASITSNGKSFAGAINFNGTGNTFSIVDAFANTNSVTLNGGTLNSNGKAMLSSTFVATTTTNSRTFNMGESVYTLTGTGSVWSVVATNLTINSGTSSINITDPSTSAITFAGGGLTYYLVRFIRGGSTASITISGSNAFAQMIDTGTAAHSILFTAATTTTVNKFNVSGSSGNVITINSTSTATFNMVKAGPGIISCDYLNIQHAVATPASTWYAGANSTNNQGVTTAGSGWVFTVPTTAKSQLSLSGAG
jgi:hypothetical protein